MARGGGRSSSRSSTPTRSAPSFNSQVPARPAPTMAPTKPAPSMPAQSTPVSSGGGFMSSIAQGMAFGAGSEVGHQAIRSFFGGIIRNKNIY